jgi:hypothetical protein
MVALVRGCRDHAEIVAANLLINRFMQEGRTGPRTAVRTSR